MKKVLSLIAALSLSISMSATVFAAEETGPAIGDLPNGQNISITAQYEKGKDNIPTVYHVTVSWEQTGMLTYTVGSDTYNWNTTSLAYDKVDGKGKWECADAKVNITVTNRSNAAVNASIAEVKAQGSLAVTGNASKLVKVNSAAKEDLKATGEEQKGYLTYTITGVTGEITEKSTIAKLTVKIEAATN